MGVLKHMDKLLCKRVVPSYIIIINRRYSNFTATLPVQAIIFEKRKNICKVYASQLFPSHLSTHQLCSHRYPYHSQICLFVCLFVKIITISLWGNSILDWIRIYNITFATLWHSISEPLCSANYKLWASL